MNKSIDRLSKLFMGRENVVGQTTIPNQEIIDGQKVKGNCTTETRSITSLDWERHLTGSCGLGISPLLVSNKCKFAALDIDIYSGLDIIELSKKYSNLPIFFCRSKSNGLHIFFFFKKLLPAKDIRQQLNEIGQLLKFQIKEVFPKQEKVNKEASSNWINIPFFSENTDPGTTRPCVYNGIELKLSQFLDIAEANLINDFETDLLNKFVLSGAPPCLLKIFSEGVVRGYRDVFLFNLGVFLRQKYKTGWEDKLKKCNQEYLSDPIDERELERNIIKQLSKKDVFYQCKSELMQWCSKKECRSKKFGITIKNSPDVLLGAIRKLKTQPPIWEIIVNDNSNDDEQSKGKEKVIKLTTAQLRNYEEICNLYLEATNILLPPLKKQAWHNVLDEKLEEGVTEIEAPEDASESARPKDIIKQFCIERSGRGRSIEDTERGHVFKSEGMNLFKGKALSDYLQSKKCIIKQTYLWDMLREMGGKEHRKSNLRLWALPLFEEQLNVVDTRKDVDFEAIRKEEDDKEAF